MSESEPPNISQPQDSTMQSLSEDFEENLQRFFTEAADCGCVWGLEGDQGWALAPSEKYSETEVMPFWSQPEFAQIHCKDEWRDYQPVAVSLEEFLEDWLPGMHNDVYLVGINWNAELEGLEMEPLDLLTEFEQLLS